jgi:hypothetical protein
MAALVFVGEPRMVNAEAMENCCLKIMNVHRILRDVVPVVVRLSNA